jgi:hypothetical protein
MMSSCDVIDDRRGGFDHPQYPFATALTSSLNCYVEHNDNIQGVLKKPIVVIR